MKEQLYNIYIDMRRLNTRCITIDRIEERVSQNRPGKYFILIEEGVNLQEAAVFFANNSSISIIDEKTMIINSLYHSDMGKEVTRTSKTISVPEICLPLYHKFIAYKVAKKLNP